MVNLLSRSGGRDAGPDAFALWPRERVAEWLRDLVRLACAERPATVARMTEDAESAIEDEEFSSELDELLQEPSRIAAEAILESIAGRRRARLRCSLDEAAANGASASGRAQARVRTADPGTGVFVCFRPGRSLSTGEAEIASRGYFDVQDKPPLATWIALLARVDERGKPRVEALDDEVFRIVAWVAPESRERAIEGCRACPNGALALLDTLTPHAGEALLRAYRELPPIRPRS